MDNGTLFPDYSMLPRSVPDLFQPHIEWDYTLILDPTPKYMVEGGLGAPPRGAPRAMNNFIAIKKNKKTS